jgi:hypothetical protein
MFILPDLLTAIWAGVRPFGLDQLKFHRVAAAGAGADQTIAAFIGPHLCGASGADRVMVKGRWLVEDGIIPGLDPEALRACYCAAAVNWLHFERIGGPWSQNTPPRPSAPCSC